MPPRPHLALPSPGTRRAVVVGAGSFGTAVAVLLARGGFRTTLQTRTPEQCRAARGRPREHAPTCPTSSCRASCGSSRRRRGSARADYVFLGVPSGGLGEVIANLAERGLDRRTPVISLAKGLVPPHGIAPTVLLTASLGAARVACVGGPAHAREMVTEGAGARRRVDRRAARRADRRRLHPRRRRVRALERPDRRRARGRGQERRRARRGRDPGPGPQRRRRRRRPHLPRGLALRRAAGRAPGVDDRARRHRRPRRHRAGAAEPQPPGGRAARRRASPRPRSPAASARPSRRSTSCRCSPTRSSAPRSRRRSPTRSTA